MRAHGIVSLPSMIAETEGRHPRLTHMTGHDESAARLLYSLVVRLHIDQRAFLYRARRSPNASLEYVAQGLAQRDACFHPDLFER